LAFYLFFFAVFFVLFVVILFFVLRGRRKQQRLEDCRKTATWLELKIFTVPQLQTREH